MTPSVLVTDGGERAALAVVRSLARAGYVVHVASCRAPSIAGSSRHAASDVEVSDPLRVPEAYARDVIEHAERVGVDAVLPITEASLLSLLPHRERLGRAAMMFPDPASFRAICDKGRVFEVAREIGIRVPDERVMLDPRDADVLSAVDCPVVLKPSRSVVSAGGIRHKLAVGYAADRHELERLVEELPASAFPLHLQQRVEGPGVGVFLLLERGGIQCRFAHRRIREKPPSGGVSVYRESVPLDPDLLDRSRCLLERFDWRGVAMVEYKLEAASGVPYLMEVNGRFWGSLQLAIDAGVDFPRHLVGPAFGEDLDPVRTYRIGVRSRWLWGDLDHLIARLRHSRATLHLPEGTPGRLRAIAAFLAGFVQGREEVFRLDDPMPGLRETLQWFQGLSRRRKGPRSEREVA